MERCVSMKVLVEFNSLMKRYNNWQANKEIELSDGATTADLIQLLEVDVNEDLGFIIVNNIKINDEVVLKDGDCVKLFPQSFGG